MQEKEALIQIYNENQEPIAVKPRKDINKNTDILEDANILIINNKNQIFMIKAKQSSWPGKWGGSCAGLVRYQETPNEAAKRTLKRELNIKVPLTHLHKKYYDFNGKKKIMNFFYGKASELKPNPDDFEETKWISIQEAEKMIKNNECMPTFEAAFKALKEYLN